MFRLLKTTIGWLLAIGFIALLLLGSMLSAQDLQITDTAVFQGSNPTPIDFSASFTFDMATNTILPGTLTYSESDPFGLGPFTMAAPVMGSGVFFNFIGNGAWIQIGNEYGLSSGTFPQVGSFGSLDTVLLCQNGCADFNGGGYIPATSGSLIITDPPAHETPELPAWMLLLAGAIGLAIFEALRRR